MISKQLLDKAAALLPKCKTLSDAERHLGGEWHEDKGLREHEKAAVAHGLFDGWKGRPRVDKYFVVHLTSVYLDAYEAGRKLSMMELPG